jgi:transcription-repair coupling factor (superfamily II helicase)
MRELVLVTDKWTEKARGIDAGFMNGEFDVLIATTIIESGLDVPMPIRFFTIMPIFLSDLQNARTCGRSNKSICYFICPPYSAMTEDARKRIQALEQFSE